MGNVHNIFKSLSIPASITQWTTPEDEHYKLKIDRNNIVLRKVHVWFAAGNQDFTNVRIKKNGKAYLPSPFSQATGKGAAGGDFFSGDDVIYPAFIINDELKENDYFEIFYKNSDGNVHSITVIYQLEDITDVKLKMKIEKREKRLATRFSEGILNALQKITGKPETRVIKEEVEPEPPEIDSDAYYKYDEYHEPQF